MSGTLKRQVVILILILPALDSSNMKKNSYYYMRNPIPIILKSVMKKLLKLQSKPMLIISSLNFLMDYCVTL